MSAFIPSTSQTFSSFTTAPTSISSRPIHGVLPRHRRPTAAANLHAPRAVLPAQVAAAAALVDPTVLKTSLRAMAKLLVTLIFGVVAAKRGFLDNATLTALSKTVYNIFLPALMLTNLVRTLAASPSPTLFFLPIAAVVQVIIGLIVAYVLSKLLRLNPSESRIFKVCAAFGNSAALPLLFANALFADSPAQLAGMVSSISFYLIGWSGLFWSIGYGTLASLPDASGVAPEKNVGIMTTLKRIFSPPLISAMLGLLIGLYAPVRNFFIASPAFAALQTLGTGYSPAAVLILAGSLARKVGQKDEESSAISLRMGRLTFGITLVRFLMMPLVAMLVLRSGGAVFKTPFAKLVILLEAIMPSAQNSTLILNLEKRPDAASAVARVLLFVYMIGIIPISIGLTFFLAVSGV